MFVVFRVSLAQSAATTQRLHILSEKKELFYDLPHGG